MELPKFEKEYQVHVYETGPDGKLSLHSLFDFFQDIASDHAVRLGYGRDDLLKNNNFWVLSRIYAEISSWPSWSEKIHIKTWPRGTDHVFALRDFVAISDKGESVAKATSSWLVIDRETKRIKRPDNKLIKLNSGYDDNKALERNAEKIEVADISYRRNQDLKIKISDLDINLHTNNTRYLRWVTDSYDLDFVLNNIPISAEINYLAESRFNDSIAILTQVEDVSDSVFRHSIHRSTDNTELCRIMICWKKRS